RNERARAITNLVDGIRVDLASLATRPGLGRNLEDLAAEFHKLNEAQRQSIIAGYTINNPFPLGTRSAVYDLGDGSEYSAKHKALHAQLLIILQLQGLTDIFLVDPRGDVVYTTAKEADFGTNLLSGPYSATGAANAFRRSLATQPPWAQVFVDM